MDSLAGGSIVEEPRTHCSRFLGTALLFDLFDANGRAYDNRGVELQPKRLPFAEAATQLRRRLSVELRVSSLGVAAAFEYLVEQIDESVAPWPPNLEMVQPLVASSLRGLSSEELLAILWAGPPRWRTAKLPTNAKYSALDSDAPRIVEKVLTGGVRSLLADWVEQDARSFFDDITARRRRHEPPTAPAQPSRSHRHRGSVISRRKDREGVGFQPPPSI
ncbi:MAG: hypothetical protein AAGD18_04735 [Actinomycetota bacterium]